MTDEDPQEREVPSGVFGGVSDDSYMDGVGRRWVIGTSVLCLIVGILGHAAIWYGYGRGLSANPIQWWSEKPVIGLSLASIALIAFGGFLEATRRMRVAISASFLLTFLLSYSYAVSISGFGTSDTEFAGELFRDFRAICLTIVGFYFGTEALIAMTKVRQVGEHGGSAAAINSADEDLAPKPSSTKQP